MTSRVPIQPLHAVPPNLQHAFGGVWRMTVRRFFSLSQGITLLGLLGLLTILVLSSIRGGREENFYAWIVHFYLTFLLPVLGFVAGASTIRDEMKSSSTDYILTRPIRRPALVGFKYVSQLLCVQGFYLLVFIFLITLGFLNQVPGLWSTAPLLLLAQIGTLFAFTAMGLFFGVLTSHYLIVGLIYAGTVELAIGRIPIPLNRVSVLHQVNVLVGPLVPSPSFPDSSWSTGFAAFALLIIFPAIFVSLGAALFSVREIGATAGRES